MLHVIQACHQAPYVTGNKGNSSKFCGVASSHVKNKRTYNIYETVTLTSHIFVVTIWCCCSWQCLCHQDYSFSPRENANEFPKFIRSGMLFSPNVIKRSCVAMHKWVARMPPWAHVHDRWRRGDASNCTAQNNVSMLSRVLIEPMVVDVYRCGDLIATGQAIRSENTLWLTRGVQKRCLR